MNKYIENGETFLKNCLFDGLAHSYDVVTGEYVKPYPEVTGYVIKYFCDNCNGSGMSKIQEAGVYLCSIQHKTGGYKTFYDNRYLYAFDTAQILNGLISLSKCFNNNEINCAIDKAGEFLLNMQRKDGAIYPVYDTYLFTKRMPKKMYPMWNGATSGLLCKVTEVYNEMYIVTGDKRYNEAVKLAVEFYKTSEPLTYTHPLGYWLEGLYAGGMEDFVCSFLKNNVISRIEDNGFIPYTYGLDYSYTSGEAQLAILMVKCGFIKEAVKIREFIRNVQRNHISGGIFQFSNREAGLDNHIHTEINSWGTKYYCELERLMEDYE